MPSLWAATAPVAAAFPALSADLTVDAVVIGGGIMGITAAYLLKRAGRTVAVLERARCGMGETTQTAGHVTAVTDVRLTDLVDAFGPEYARAVWQAGFAAMARIRANVRDERINCQFAWVPGYLYASRDAEIESARTALQREADVAATLGIEAMYVDDIPGLGRPAVAFDSQARFHPLAYLQVLASRIPGAGSHVFERSEVTIVEDDPLTVWVGHQRIRTDYVVIATEMPTPAALGIAESAWLETNLFSYRSYVTSGIASRGAIPEGLFWENVDGPYEYLRVDRRGDHDDEVILGGRDHWAGQVEDSEERLTTLARRLADIVPDVRITCCWSGEVIETRDGLPYIGEVYNRRFVGTGFAGNGLTFGTLAGMMAAEAAQGRSTPWADLFDIRRPHHAAVGSTDSTLSLPS